MFKSLLKNLSVIVVASLSLMSQANAANYVFNFGNVATVVNRDADVLTNFEFNDVFDLDLQEPVSLSILVGEVEEPSYNIIDETFKYGFYDAENNLITSPFNLTPGKYQLRVSGAVDGFSGGQYFLNANVVTPVPEADKGILLMVGLLMIGLVSLRKAH